MGGIPTTLSTADFLQVELAPGGADGLPERWYTNAALQADLDGGGHTDLLIANYCPDGARAPDPTGASVEELHDTEAKAFCSGRKHLFRWTSGRGGVAPESVYQEPVGVLDEPVDRGWTLAAGVIGIDGDLLPELYLANDLGPGRLLRNRSIPGRFRFRITQGRSLLTEPTSCRLAFDSLKGMGADFADLNGDGAADIFVSSIVTEYGL